MSENKTEGSRSEASRQSRATILARRRRFVAAAMLGAGVAAGGCKEPQPCLSQPRNPVSSAAPSSTEAPSSTASSSGETTSSASQSTATDSTSSESTAAGATVTPSKPRMCLRTAPPRGPAPKICLSDIPD